METIRLRTKDWSFILNHLTGRVLGEQEWQLASWLWNATDNPLDMQRVSRDSFCGQDRLPRIVWDPVKLFHLECCLLVLCLGKIT